MKKKIALVIIAVLPIAYLIFAFNNVPDQVVVHWNIHGEADRYGSKLMYIVLAMVPLLIVICYQLYLKFSKTVQNQKNLNQLISTLVAFFAILAILFISQSTNEQLEITKILVILFGALFIVIGNMMNKLNKNLTFGIRIPATLRNQKVWNRVHYVGGYGFVGLGVLTVIAGLIFTNSAISLGIMVSLMLIMVISITIYAEILYRRETGHCSLSKSQD